MNIEFFVKDFSETTRPRILKFGKKLGNDKLYCVTKNQPHIAYQSLYLSIFLFLLQNFLLQIYQLLFEPESLNFVYKLRTTKCITRNKTKVPRFIFAFFFYFFLFQSLVPR